MRDRNMNARNFGLFSRDMKKAAKNALVERQLSYSSVATLAHRFNRFSEWALENCKLKDLRHIQNQHLISYGAHISALIKSNDLAISTGQNYLSAVNTVLQQARQDNKVSINPSDFTNKRNSISTVNKANTWEDRINMHKSLSTTELGKRQLSAFDLTEAYGLRIKEASLLNIKSALRQAENESRIHITKGTKGGRPRWIPIRSERQIELLRRACTLQGTGTSLLPENMNWKQWRQELYQASKRVALGGFHGGRHLYSQRLYKTLTNTFAPIVAGIRHGKSHFKYISDKLNISIKQARIIDYEARIEIATELGHGRTDVTNTYLG